MKNTIWKNAGFFLIITLVSIIAARAFEYLIHESGHYLIARMMGITFQTNPVQTVLTSPFLIQMYQGGIYGFSESFGYQQYIMTGPAPMAGLIAIGGLFLNGLIAIVCFWLFLKTRVIKSKGLMTITLWILIFNLGSLFSNIPLRVFSPRGDVSIFLSSLWIHPIVFLFPMLILMGIALSLYFTTILPLYCISIPLKSKALRILVLVCSTLIFIMYMIGPILFEFHISELLKFPELTDLFPVIVIGQSIFLVALFLLGLIKILNLDATRYLLTKKNV